VHKFVVTVGARVITRLTLLFNTIVRKEHREAGRIRMRDVHAQKDGIPPHRVIHVLRSSLT